MKKFSAMLAFGLSLSLVSPVFAVTPRRLLPLKALPSLPRRPRRPRQT